MVQLFSVYNEILLLVEHKDSTVLIWTTNILLIYKTNLPKLYGTRLFSHNEISETYLFESLVVDVYVLMGLNTEQYERNIPWKNLFSRIPLLISDINQSKQSTQ